MVHTIGFTKTTAEDFFTRLEQAGVKRVIDVRLNTSSQLSGFAKARDLKYFLRHIAGIDYVHELSLAPTAEMLGAYRKGRLPWDRYEASFIELIRERKIEDTLDPDLLDGGCLLCSESTPHHCHRRLVAEYLKQRWQVNFEIVHL